MSTHKAVWCDAKTLGGWQALRVVDVPTPEVGDNDVMVAVKAAGVAFPDTLITKGQYQFKPTSNFAPGGEIAGDVVKVGKAVKEFKVGDRVMALTGWGGMQERIVLRPEKLLRLPKELSYEAGAGYVFNYGTTIHALRDRGQLKAGETVLVLGAAGGLGVTAIEVAKAMGAKVIAACSTEDKAQVCRSFGADDVILYTKEKIKDRVAEITGGNGVDVVYDAVGGEYAEPALRSMAWRGRYLVLGFVAGIPKIPLNLTLLKGCSVNGVFWGSFTNREPEAFAADVEQLHAWVRQGKIHPDKTITETWPMDKAAEAIGRLEQRKVKGKAVVVMGAGGGARL